MEHPVTSRSIRIAIVAAMAAGSLIPIGWAVPAAATPGPGKPAVDLATVTEQPDAASALAVAKKAKRAIEIANKRTEVAKFFANPDGTSSIEQYVTPQRARRADGTWGDIDTTLRRNPDGSLSPVAVPVALRFSDGGTGPVITMTKDGRQLSLTWPGSLSKPVVAGEVATYPDVLPGVDLRVRANRTGFQKVFVVKTSVAAANPALSTLTFKTHTEGITLKTEKNGALSAVDSKGTVVFSGGTPFMWDSTPPTAAALEAGDSPSVDWGPSRDGRRANVAVSVTGQGLTMRPDQPLLSNPDAKFPVLIDPSFGEVNAHTWAFVTNAYPNNNYLNGGSWPAGDGQAMVGMDPGGQVFRSYFQFQFDFLMHKQVQEANFIIEATHASVWACDEPSNPFRIFESGGVGGGTTWNSQPWWGAVQADRTETRGNYKGSCPNNETLYTNVQPTVQRYANDGWPHIAFGMHAHNEGNSNGWRRFNANSAKLWAKYSSPPVASGLDTVPGSACGGGGRALLGNANDYRFTAFFDDPDGDSLTAYLRFDEGGVAGRVQKQTSIPDANWANWTVGANELEHGKIYDVWAFGIDWWQGTADYCQVEIDKVAPKPPGISSDVYKRNEMHGSVGMTGEFTFTAAAGDTDVTGFYWGFDTPTNYVAASNGTAKVLITPPSDGTKLLHVKAVDRAGNQGVIGADDVWKFSVNVGTPPIGHWTMDGSAADTNYGSGDPDHPATLSAGAVIVPGSTDEEKLGRGSYLSLNGTTAYASTAGQVVDTTRGFTVAAWVKRTSNSTLPDGSHRTVLSQDGNVNSAFFLQYAPTTNKWVFCMPPNDSTDPQAVCAESDAVSDLNIWTHLAGSYDPAASKIYLFVNGKKYERPVIRVIPAANRFNIGQVRWLNAFNNWFPGAIDDVRAYNRVAAAEEVAALAKRLEGQWSFEDSGNTTFADSSPRARSLSRYDFVRGEAGFYGQGVTFNSRSAAGEAYRSGATVASNTSYTVSAWVRLTNGDASATAVSQSGSNNFAYRLGFDKATDKWAFVLSEKDTAGAATKTAYSQQVAKLGEWTHLTGVYNADRREILLWVNGDPQGDPTGSVTAWNGATYTDIGCYWVGTYQQRWDGQIDEISFGAGALDRQEIGVLASKDGRVPTPPLPLAGDVDNDTKTDVFVVTGQTLDKKTRIQVYKAQGNGFATPETWWTSDAGTFPVGWQHDGSKWTVGDFDGDGRADLAAFTIDQANPRDTNLWVFYTNDTGTGFRDTDQDIETLTPDLMKWDNNPLLGWPIDNVKIDSGKFNNDVRTDIVATWSATGASGAKPLVFLAKSSGGFDQPAEWTFPAAAGRTDLFLIDQVVGDFNADGKSDLGHYYRTGAGTAALTVYHSNGTGFDAPVETWTGSSWSLERMKNVVGNFDADAAGKADIAGLVSKGSPNYSIQIFAAAGAPAQWLDNTAASSWGRMTPFAGDFNGDLKTDYAYLDYLDPRNPQVKITVNDSTGTGFAGWRPVV